MISWLSSVAIKRAVAVIYLSITLAIDTWLERYDLWRGATVNCLPAWGLNSTMTWRSLTVFDIWLALTKIAGHEVVFYGHMWKEESNMCQYCHRLTWKRWIVRTEPKLRLSEWFHMAADELAVPRFNQHGSSLTRSDSGKGQFFKELLFFMHLTSGVHLLNKVRHK